MVVAGSFAAERTLNPNINARRHVDKLSAGNQELVGFENHFHFMY